jgi:hypothetical protein
MTLNSARRYLTANGSKINEAKMSRQAAIAREGASSWAKRTRMALIEVAKTPTKRIKTGGRKGRWGMDYGRRSQAFSTYVKK